MLERFTFRDVDSAYASFLKHSGLQECVILQTCNRVELFGCTSTTNLEKIKKTWASVAGLEEHAFKDNLEISKGTDAYAHLLKLTSGLDSQFGSRRPISCPPARRYAISSMRHTGAWM